MSPKWKPKPVSASSRALNLSGGPHAHRCGLCGSRYEDACGTPFLDDTCGPCRGGREPPPWVEGRRPQACCFASSRKATHEERQTYRLGGTSTWWICTRCKRTHPNEPRREK